MAAITAAVIGVAGSMYVANKAAKQQDKAIQESKEAQAAADPYAAYRASAAQKLNALTNDPTSIEGTASYKARLQAAARAAAANGFTGSGNAVIAAANAGGEAYQQEFSNLALLSGAAQGLTNATSAYGASTGAMSAANDNSLSGSAGVINNVTNLASVVGSRFNRPSAPAPIQYAPAPTTSSGANWMNAYGAV